MASSHSLKGASLSVGAVALAEAARALEDAGRAGNVETAHSLIALLLEAYAEARDAMVAHLDSAA